MKAHSHRNTSATERQKLFCLLAAFVLAIGLFHMRGNLVSTEELGHSAFRWMTVRWTDKISYGGVDYSHGWMIPLVSLWLLWRSRDRLRQAPRTASIAGLAVMIGALLLHFAGLRIAQTRLSLMALILLFWAMPLYVYGWAVARVILFPCAYLVFCIPLNFLQGLTFPLRLMASAAATWLLNGLGIPSLRSGCRIFSTTGHGFDFNVADPCSGLRSMLAIAALTAAYAYLTQKTLLQKWTLFLMAIPIAVAGNILRIVAVGIVAQMFGQEVATGMYHDYSGYFIFVVVVLLMISAGAGLTRLSELWRELRPRVEHGPLRVHPAGAKDLESEEVKKSLKQ